MTWPWVSTAPVLVTTSEPACAGLNAWSGSSAAARAAAHSPFTCSARARQAAGARRPAWAAPSASAANPCRASAMMPVAPSRSASRGVTLMLANRTAGLANSDCEAVAKSVSRAPTVSTRSASRASALAAGVPSRPMPPICHQARCCTAPFPAKVSTTGMPAEEARRSSSAVAPE